MAKLGLEAGPVLVGCVSPESDGLDLLGCTLEPEVNVAALILQLLWRNPWAGKAAPPQALLFGLFFFSLNGTWGQWKTCVNHEQKFGIFLSCYHFIPLFTLISD